MHSFSDFIHFISFQFAFIKFVVQAMQSAALDEHHVVFCIEHCWISYLPEIMNPIEAVLEGSEIPNLFGDDLETIAKPLKSFAQQDGFQDSLVAYFWFSKSNDVVFETIN